MYPCSNHFNLNVVIVLPPPSPPRHSLALYVPPVGTRPPHGHRRFILFTIQVLQKQTPRQISASTPIDPCDFRLFYHSSTRWFHDLFEFVRAMVSRALSHTPLDRRYVGLVLGSKSQACFQMNLRLQLVISQLLRRDLLQHYFLVVS